jgi:hypothetical protein
LEGNWFWQEASKLKVDKTFFLAIAENLTPEEREAGAMMRLATPFF